MTAPGASSITQADDVAGRRLVEDLADVVIVGSGASGATAARVLSGAGLEVVIVEEGPNVPDADLRGDVYTAFRRVWRDVGMQVARGRAFTPVLQGSCVGGTTAINGAIIHRIPEVVHAGWQSTDGGVGELLSLDRLNRAYDRLDEELSVGRAPEDVLGNNAKRMRDGVRALGWQGNEIRRSVKGCRGTARCNQGCPGGRKQSMNVSFIPRALAAGARLYATCKVERVLAENGRAAVVTGHFRDPETRRWGPELRVRARHAVVLAASAIQTPLLLAASGVGRASGLVGRRLQAHPGAGVVGVFDRPVEMWFGATQAYETMHHWNDRMKFETVGMPLELAAARFPEMGAPLMRRMADFGQVAIWGVEIRARAHGRVRRGLFGGTDITYDLTDDDVRTMKLGIKRLTQMMFAAGAREVLPGVHGLPDRITSVDGIEPIFDLPDDPRLLHFIAGHLFGTARMGRSAGSAVVGPEMESFEMPGLYVVDSSVFPTNIGVNPQHTISAVAWLAAERLAERLTG